MALQHDTGILLIHGFAGGRDEVRPLRHALEAMGYDVETPVLPGHEGTRAQLGRATCGAWLDSAQHAYDALQRRNARVAAVGFSMGGLVAVQLNARVTLAALVTVNTPIYYWHKRRILRNLLGGVHTPAHYLRQAGKAPLPALWSFLETLKRAKPLIGGITCPLLVVQALDDDTSHPRSAQYILGRARGPKSAYMPAHGGHQLIVNGGAGHIARRVHALLLTL